MDTVQKQTRKPLGELVDDAIRGRLHDFIVARGWRTAITELGIAERALRSSLAGRPVRHATAVAIRVGLDEVRS
jgi:hypothetical protein